MSNNLKQSITEFLKPQVSALGFASVDRFADAPESHHPKRICRDAETVIVFGITVPRGMLKSPDYNLYALHRSYHSAYMRIDDLSPGWPLENPPPVAGSKSPTPGSAERSFI